jgi:hypothetical protein
MQLINLDNMHKIDILFENSQFGLIFVFLLISPRLSNIFDLANLKGRLSSLNNFGFF